MEIFVFLKISPMEAQSYWDDLYHKTAALCIHYIRYRKNKQIYSTDLILF